MKNIQEQNIQELKIGTIFFLGIKNKNKKFKN